MLKMGLRLMAVMGGLLTGGVVALMVSSSIDPVPIELLPAKIVPPGIDIPSQVQPIGSGLPIPESIAVGSDGWLYTGAADGWIYRQPLPTQDQDRGDDWEKFSYTGGYVIGLEFNERTQSFWAANFSLGLQEIRLDGAASIVADTAEGISIGFADDLMVADDGTIYFTDASTKFNPLTTSQEEPYVLWDILEGTANGRLITYSPGTMNVSVLLHDLYFPSGISLSPSGDYLLFVEVSRYRVMRHWLKGDNKGKTEVFSEALPGIPDDVHISASGDIWITLVAPRDPFLDSVAYPSPLIRRLLAGLPNTLLSSMEEPQGGASIVRINETGDITCRYLLPGIDAAANIIEQNGALYAGVLNGQAPLKVTASRPC